MQTMPVDELRQALALGGSDDGIDNPQAIRLKRKAAEEFRKQLTLGALTNEDEADCGAWRSNCVRASWWSSCTSAIRCTQAFHLLFRDDYNNPIIGYLGSSNLTMAGLRPGELNIDVLDGDAVEKLAAWFEDR